MARPKKVDQPDSEQETPNAPETVATEIIHDGVTRSKSNRVIPANASCDYVMVLNTLNGAKNKIRRDRAVKLAGKNPNQYQILSDGKE